jgi:hypothetical protein
MSQKSEKKVSYSNGMNPRESAGLKNHASTEEPSLRARRSQLNLAFASAEALSEGGLTKIQNIFKIHRVRIITNQPYQD